MNKRASTIAKGIAVLMLFCHHLFYSNEKIAVLSSNQGLVFWPLSQDIIIQISQSFKCCVSIFVFITGYGIFRQVEAKFSGAHTSKRTTARELSAYSFSRLIKLYSGFWVVFLLAQSMGLLLGRWTLFDAYGGNGDAAGLMRLTIDFFGLSDLFGTATYNDTWWYLSLAITLIFLAPLFSLAAIRIGSSSLLALSVMIPLTSDWGMNRLWRYAFVLALGIFCAKTRLFEHLKARFSLDDNPTHLHLVLLGTFLTAVVLLYARQKAIPLGITWVFEAIAAAVICWGAQLLSQNPNKLLFVFGKHSMNIFLLHTFIYKYFFKEAVAFGEHFVLVLLLLAVYSLVVSVAIERLKAVIGYNELFSRISSCVASTVLRFEH